MPRAFRSRQFLIDLALKGSLHFPTVSSTFSVSGCFICGILNDKHTYFCRRCSWTCRQRSANRLFEHAVFGKHVKLSSYLDIRGTGNCTAPCSQPVDKEEALDMADLGEPAAITWCKFNRWLPLSWQPSSRTSIPAQGELQMAGHALDQGAFATLDCRAFAGGRMFSGCVFRTLKNAQRKNALVCSGETCVRFLGPGRTHWGLCACIFGDLEEGTASGLYAMWRPTCVHFRGLEERRLGLNPLAQAQNAA